MNERLFAALLTIFNRKGEATYEDAATLIDLGMVRFENCVFYVTELGAERVIRRLPPGVIPENRDVSEVIG